MQAEKKTLMNLLGFTVVNHPELLSTMKKLLSTNVGSKNKFNYGETLIALTRHLINRHPQLLPIIHGEIVMPHDEQLQVKMKGNFSYSSETENLRKAYEQSMALNTKVPRWITLMEGMSGTKYRYLINSLLESMQEVRYLEVGSWKGSTVCSAMYGNSGKAICIDNWSEFGGPKTDFLTNIQKVVTEKTEIEHIEEDFRKVDWTRLPKSNVYLFDGPHQEIDQIEGITFALPALEDSFYLIIDDYNFPEVRKGTQTAISQSGLHVHCALEIRTTQNDKISTFYRSNYSDWHNGYYIAYVSKNNSEAEKF